MINADKKGEGIYDVSDVKGQYVKRLGKSGKIQNKVYLVECYRGDLKRWQLADFDDINRCVYIKPGTKVYAGFTF